jgi:hypothetical protein
MIQAPHEALFRGAQLTQTALADSGSRPLAAAQPNRIPQIASRMPGSKVNWIRLV